MKAPRLLMISFVLLAMVAVIAMVVLIVSTVSAQGAEAASAMRHERVPHGSEPVSAGSGWAGEIDKSRSWPARAGRVQMGREPVSADSGLGRVKSRGYRASEEC